VIFCFINANGRWPKASEMFEWQTKATKHSEQHHWIEKHRTESDSRIKDKWHLKSFQENGYSCYSQGHHSNIYNLFHEEK
jgi:hypothetical protein